MCAYNALSLVLLSVHKVMHYCGRSEATTVTIAPLFPQQENVGAIKIRVGAQVGGLW